MDINNRITIRFDHMGQKLEQQSDQMIDAKVIQESIQEEGKIDDVHSVSQIFVDHIESNHVEKKVEKDDELFAEHPNYIYMESDLDSLEQLIRESSLPYQDDFDLNKDKADKPQEEHLDEVQEQVHEQINKHVNEQVNKHVNEQVTPLHETVLIENSFVQHDLDYTKYENQGVEDVQIEHFTAITRKRSTPSWGHVFISVTAALATGILFGYMILSFIFGAKLWPFDAIQSSSNKPISLHANTEIPTGEQDVNPSFAPVNQVALENTQLHYSLLQFGVFSNAESRDVAIAQLQQKGLPASYTKEENGQYYVYAAIAESKEEMSGIMSYFDGLDTFHKEVSISLPNQVRYNGTAEQLMNFFKQTDDLMMMTINLVNAQLEQPSLSAIGEAAYQSWNENQQQWLKDADAALIHWTQYEEEYGQAKLVYDEMMNVISLLQQYQQEQSITKLWSIHAAILNIVLIEKQWFAS